MWLGVILSLGGILGGILAANVKMLMPTIDAIGPEVVDEEL